MVTTSDPSIDGREIVADVAAPASCREVWT
jgi:hypothetical protein